MNGDCCSKIIVCIGVSLKNTTPLSCQASPLNLQNCPSPPFLAIPLSISIFRGLPLPPKIFLSLTSSYLLKVTKFQFGFLVMTKKNICFSKLFSPLNISDISTPSFPFTPLLSSPPFLKIW